MNTIRNLSIQPLWRVLVVFFFFAVADFFLTWKLMEHDASGVIESNPLAASVLSSYGWFGLAGYKFALVMTFFALAMVVERRRQMGGLLLLVFACGVHAAVVTSSAFLYLENARVDPAPEWLTVTETPYQPLPIGSMALLTQKPIQAELKLSQEQVAASVQAARRRRELSREMINGHLDECQSKLLIVTAMEQTLIGNFSRAQLKRLHQLTLQKRGVAALLDTNVALALKLTSEQQATIIDILQKLPAQSKQARRQFVGAGSSRDAESLKQELQAAALNVLTDAQKSLWIGMQGVPYCFQSGRSVVVSAQATE